ncbi:MAG: SAM-dependent methyltransferase [Alphaproteobacteria bacterium]|nr:SAM-dependent methyltransferase [Alphaproteobacteria bacterium]
MNSNNLEDIIKSIIKQQGPISVAAFMALALQHPNLGYYTTRNPIGRTGDFVTSPEVSQLFGEILGVWCVDVWTRIGKPDSFALLEMGAGSGVMMHDIIRVTEKVSEFANARKVFILESNKVLKDKQKSNIPCEYSYVDSVSSVPHDLPLIIVANEFFDVMPVRQFEKTFQGWAECMVDIENNSLALALRTLSDFEQQLIPPEKAEALPGTVFEFSPVSQSIMKEAAEAIAQRKGAMLVVDYGYSSEINYSTLQAVSKHKRASIFDNPGETDISYHVDFRDLAKVAETAGADVSFIVTQGEFLENFGIRLRAEKLKHNVNKKQALEIDTALKRLTSDDEMGSVFKVMEVVKENVKSEV